MDVLKNYRIHRLIALNNPETGQNFMFKLGKRYSVSGICTHIEFDWEEYEKSGDKIFHIWCENDAKETRCWGSLINWKVSVQYDTEI